MRRRSDNGASATRGASTRSVGQTAISRTRFVGCCWLVGWGFFCWCVCVGCVCWSFVWSHSRCCVGVGVSLCVCVGWGDPPTWLMERCVGRAGSWNGANARARSLARATGTNACVNWTWRRAAAGALDVSRSVRSRARACVRVCVTNERAHTHTHRMRKRDFGRPTTYSTPMFVCKNAARHNTEQKKRKKDRKLLTHTRAHAHIYLKVMWWLKYTADEPGTGCRASSGHRELIASPWRHPPPPPPSGC